MTLSHCFDAAHPPATAPPHCAAVLGYVGGPHETHMWTLAEWQRFSHLHQFPAWVCDYTGNAFDQANIACARVAALGWDAKLHRALIGDVETDHNRVWWATFADQVKAHGYTPVCYGSLSSVLTNAERITWAADWNGTPALVAGETVEAVQYAHDLSYGGTTVDLSVVTPELLALAGVGPRK